MELEEPLLHQPASPSPVAAYSIITRLLFILFIALTSIWANHEASKGFQVTVLNDAGDSTPRGRRFNLLFSDDDRAVRIILNASGFVERLLYPDERYPRKPVGRVTLRIAGEGSTAVPAVEAVGPQPGQEFEIRVHPAVVDGAEAERKMAAVVLRAVARVWLWGWRGGVAPLPPVVEGMVECIAAMAGAASMPGSVGTCGVDGAACEAAEVAQFLRCCERVRKGSLARLNRAMKDGWHVRSLGDVLGSFPRGICLPDLSRIDRVLELM